jgi:uncharacterized protein
MADLKKPERRFMTTTLKRAQPVDGVASRTVEGYAAVFNSTSGNLGWFTEKIDPHAFDKCDMSDVVALFNHDPNFILARTPNTLKIDVDERGLKYSFEAPETTAGNDLLISLDRGDVNSSSFAFDVNEEAWECKDNGEPDERTVLGISKLYDVSPVTYPAYPDTEVAHRSHDKFKELSKNENTSFVQRSITAEKLRLLDLTAKK